MTDKVDEALGAIGLDPDDVDPAVLAGLRKAAAKSAQQLDRADLKSMTPDQIVKAKADGKLENVLGRGSQ